MAAKTGQALKHKDPRGRELSGTHDYEQRRQSSGKKVLTSEQQHPWEPRSSRSMLPEHLPRSGKKVLTSQQERPWVPRPRLTMLPEQLGRPGQGDVVRSKERHKIPNYDLFGANSSNRSSSKYLARSHGQYLVDRASSSSTHVQHVSRGQATSVLIPGEHKERETASILCTGACSTHGQHGSSSKQLSKSKYQEQGLSRSQRLLQYSSSQDTSKSQVQPWVSSQKLISTTSIQNQGSWKGYEQAPYPVAGQIRVDVIVNNNININFNVVDHASPGQQQHRGPFAIIGEVLDEIYNFTW